MAAFLVTFGRNILAILTSRELIAAFLGAVFAFPFAVAWDLQKDYRKRAVEEQHAVRLLRAEIMTNLDLLEGARNHLVKDTELSRQEDQLHVPLAPLSTRSWESVSLAGVLPSNRRDLFDEIGKTYVAAATLNQRIQARELYRAANQALTQYAERRALINQHLLKDVESLLGRFRDHLDKLSPS